MPQYDYADPGGDIVIMALRIEKAGLVVPDGMVKSGTKVGVIYNVALTAGQKTTLDSTMATVNLGTIPASANSVYTIDDVMDERASFKTTLAAAGFTCDVYPFGASQLKLVFSKVLTTANKNSLAAAWAGLLKQTQ